MPEGPGRQDRGRTEKRAEISQSEGVYNLRFFDCHSDNKRNDERKNMLKREGRETKHEKCIEIDKGDTEMR
jgi:hypothetical protein